MYDKTAHKIKVIQAKDPVSFQRQYNEAAEELDKYDPEITVERQDGVYYALFMYTLHKPVPETLNDVFTLKGIAHTCAECPYLEIGTDNRRKLWPCEYAESGMTNKDAPACEKLLTDLMRGKIKLRSVEAQDYD